MSTLLNRVDRLRGAVQGDIVLPGDTTYDTSRRIWNAMIDRRPAAIVRCASAADVVHAMAFGREQGLEISIRGGGHNIAGTAVCDGGVMIDLSPMQRVAVDPATRRALVEPGATLADVDAATQAHGLAVPLGINSTTGVAGLTLGGGFGWLTRKYGMTIDNLVAADVVTADGRTRRASDEENADLFWALRGGGGNFGVVTRFEFRLHPVGPDIVAGLVIYPLEQAKRVLTAYRALVETAPEELTAWIVLRQCPPLPFVPAAVHGTPVVVVALAYTGDAGGAAPVTEPLTRLGDAHAAHIGPVAYVQWQQAFDPLLTPGARNYWKSHNFTALGDEALGQMIASAGELPSPDCEIFVASIGGAANRVVPDAMAYGHRQVKFVMNVHGRWTAAGDDDRCIGWARRVHGALSPYASGGTYVNFMTGDEGDRVAAAYGENYERLARVKERYDPGNVFHLNQNIRPYGRDEARGRGAAG
jgi:FAD/FMN-containing dehydrogenase